jgi:ABC-type branched-subunit amino acid transport system substrate-binding protein
MKPSRKLPGVGALALLLALMSCDGAQTEGTPGEVRAITGLSRCTVVEEGYYYMSVALPFTGSLAQKATSRERAVRLALDEINAAGGIGGRAIGLVTCDTRKEASVAAQVVRELGEVAPGPAVIGPATSSCTLAAAPEAVAARLVLVSPSATSAEITDLEDEGFVSRTAMSDAFQGVALAHLAHDEAMTRVYVVYRQDAYGEGLKDVFVGEFEGLGGQTEVLGYDEVHLDAAAVAAAIDAFAPDTVLLISFVDDGAAIIKAVLNAGTQAAWLLTDGTKDPGLLEKVGDPSALEGALGTIPSVPEGDTYARFAETYQSAWGAEPLGFSANAYDAAWLVASAMALASDPDDGAEVRDRLGATSTGAQVTVGDWSAVLDRLPDGQLDIQGASGPVDLDANGDVLTKVEVWQVQGGSITTVGCRQPSGEVCP